MELCEVGVFIELVSRRNRAFVNQLVRPQLSKTLKRNYYESKGYASAYRGKWGAESSPRSFSEGVEAINDNLEIRSRFRRGDEGQIEVEPTDALEDWRGISEA